MIATIILATLLGIGAILYLIDLGANTPAILETLVTPITLTISQLFKLLGYLSPLLIAIIPLYLVLKTNKTENTTHLTFSAIYGLSLYALAVLTGLDTQLIQAMRGSIFLGSTLTIAINPLGILGQWIHGILTGLLLWGTGLVIILVEALLDGLIGLGETARHGKNASQTLKNHIIDRIGGKNSK